MFRLSAAAALLVVASASTGVVELARASLSGGRSLEYATQLTAQGSRLTGSAAYERAAEWSVQQFRAAGLTQVTLEPFSIERGWERGSARARIVAPVERAVHVESLGWTPSTPEGGFEAEVIATFRRS